jgi:uncharacterized membrane protein YdjX (TVP38/TMEM64 family)
MRAITNGPGNHRRTPASMRSEVFMEANVTINFNNGILINFRFTYLCGSSPQKMKRKTIVRLAILGIIMVSLALLAKFTPLGQYLSYRQLSETLYGAVALGIVIFLAAYTAGALMNLPAFLFTTIAFLVYGLSWGYAIAFLGSFLAAYAHFLLVRSIGGQALTEIKMPLMQKIMAKFDSRPLITIFILRFLFFVSPPVNYLLALSNVRTQHFVLGTIVGNILPLGLHAALLYFIRDWVLRVIS